MVKKIVAIVQARIGSTRFPGKVLENINGHTAIGLLFKRLSKSKKINNIVLATVDDKNNDQLANHVKNEGYAVFRGEENNVLGRYYDAALQFEASSIVRITGDCPLIDSEIVDNVITLYENEKVDYASNVDPPTFPDGLDVEVFSFESLKEANKKATELYDVEHVTPYIRKNKKFTKANLFNYEDVSKERWTLDNPEDLIVIKKIFNHFKPDIYFNQNQILSIRKEYQHYFEANKNIKRNTGSKIGKGQKLYIRAKKIIPGGTMLLSKRPEIFLPEGWPAYYSKAKGCKVWDLDGKEYIDMSIMGIGTNTLGYGHSEVDAAVMETVKKSNMSTLNCPEEVYLAERLVELNPWSDMVRFARSGGEANAISIRIARAATGKDKVAICGYHGWHDWYLAANLGKGKELDGHLLPGLEPNGVPRNLNKTVYPFKYNDIDSLIEIIDSHDIGVIKMEVSRSEEPKNNFLKNIRDLATKNNIVLIFDECTSGFRETFGGLHKKYGIDPDMAMFGKTLGNGYAITACLGRKEIMEAGQSTFISSTFWTERIGPAAALKTLEVMENIKSWEIISETGKKISERWKKLAEKYNIPLKISGLPALANFTIMSNNWLKYKTFITQEMLKNGYLAGNSIYVSIAHNDSYIDAYFETLEPIFSKIQDFEKNNDIDSHLDGPVCHSAFERLN